MTKGYKVNKKSNNNDSDNVVGKNNNTKRISNKKDFSKKFIQNNSDIADYTDTEIMGTKKIQLESGQYPIYVDNKTSKIYLSLNSNNIREAMTRDCQIGEIYDEIKFKLEADMTFMGSIILGMISKYSTDFIGRAKESNHSELIGETFETVKTFAETLEFFKDIWIPHQLKDIAPNNFIQKSETIEKIV